jgi:caffeoyl-CoA O-methyltransferase
MEITLYDRILTFDPTTQRGLVKYVRETFAPEDAVLQTVRRNTIERGLPEIQIRPEEGQILQFLAAISGARRILEIGTLAGYSGIWLARGLPEGGKLTTIEFDPKHARVAREHFALAGVADRVEIVEGEAHHVLAGLAQSEPFDMAFIDADKEGYPDYLAWAVNHVRSGGLITLHNAFRGGLVLEPDSDEKAVATRDTLATMAQHPKLMSTIIPVGDGIAAALVK